MKAREQRASNTHTHLGRPGRKWARPPHERSRNVGELLQAGGARGGWQVCVGGLSSVPYSLVNLPVGSYNTMFTEKSLVKLSGSQNKNKSHDSEK